MMRQRWHVSFVLIAAAAGVVSLIAGARFLPAFAPQSTAPSGPPTLILGTVASDPGTTATIPLYYKPGAGQPIRNVHLEVEFISNSVKFAKAEKGVASQAPVVTGE